MNLTTYYGEYVDYIYDYCQKDQKSSQSFQIYGIYLTINCEI